jgi:ferredoxin
MKKPVVELSECILCEVCIEVCPAVFSLNEAGFICVAELTDYPEADVEEAMKNCPADCIYWSEE